MGVSRRGETAHKEAWPHGQVTEEGQIKGRRRAQSALGWGYWAANGDSMERASAIARESTGGYVGTHEVLSPSEVPMSLGRNTFNTGDFAWVGKQYGTAFALSFVIHGMGRQALRDWAFTHSPPLCHYQLGPDGHRLPNLG